VPRVEFGCVLVNWAPGVGKQKLVEGQILGEFSPLNKTLWWGEQENLHHEPKYCY
jgi:hypothetical protein